MPTYEYRCKACDENLEVFQSFTDDPLTTCPSCAGELRKVYSPVGIAFKGSGFYKTDSRSSSSKSGSSSSESKDTKSTENTGSATSESKSSESKSEPKASESKSSDSKSPSSAAAS